MSDSDSDTVCDTRKTPAPRKRGRPPANPKPDQPRLGILSEPSDAANIMELSYYQPPVIKQLFKSMKQSNALLVQVIFRPTEVVFFTRDHNGLADIYMKLDATKLHGYYLSPRVGDISIGLHVKNMNQILKSVVKEHKAVGFSMNSSMLEFCVTLVDQYSDVVHRVAVQRDFPTLSSEVEAHLLNEAAYTCSFQMSPIAFKRKLTNISECTEEAVFHQSTVQREDDGIVSHLQIIYTSTNKSITTNDHMRDTDIKFSSSLTDAAAPLCVKVKIKNLKSAMGCLPANGVLQMYLSDERAPLGLYTMDNETVTVRVLTQFSIEA